MGKNLFSVPIFFIVFREATEGALILAILLGLAHQIGCNTRSASSARPTGPSDNGNTELDNGLRNETAGRLARKLKIQIILGGLLGFIIALAIAAAFIAVWFTKGNDLFSKAGALWKAILELIASIMIFVLGLSILELKRARIQWHLRVQRAFDGKHVDWSTSAGKCLLFFLPFVIVLREGLEVVVFVGGVSLGQPATSIPIAAIVGLVAGLLAGIIMYQFASRITLTMFMVVMTNILLLIGAGLFSSSVWWFEWHQWLKLLGGPSDNAAGDGPGTYPVQGNVWHLDCCNPINISDKGWSVFNAILGWTNSATYGSILSYVFYWLAIIVALAYMKFKGGRVKKESPSGVPRHDRKENTATSASST